MRKDEALALGASLKPCPFCGAKPTVKVRGPAQTAANPSARCTTEGCMGAALPVLCLDVPSQIQAWNRRASDTPGNHS